MENIIKLIGRKIIRSSSSFSFPSFFYIKREEERIGKIAFYIDEFLLYLLTDGCYHIEYDKMTSKSFQESQNSKINKNIWNSAEILYFRIREIAANLTDSEKNIVIFSQECNELHEPLNIYFDQEDLKIIKRRYGFTNVFLLADTFIEKKLTNITENIPILELINSDYFLTKRENIQIWMVKFIYHFFLNMI